MEFLCPILVRRRGALRIASSSFEADGSQMGPLFLGCCPAEVQAALNEWCLDHEIQYAVFAGVDPRFGEWTQPANVHFLPDEQRPQKCTYRVNTTGSFNLILARAAKRFRETLRKSKRRGVTVCEWTQVRHLEEHLNLRSHFHLRKGIKPLQSNLGLTRLVQSLANDGRLRAYHALVKGQVVASLVAAKGPWGYYGVDSVSSLI